MLVIFGAVALLAAAGQAVARGAGVNGHVRKDVAPIRLPAAMPRVEPAIDGAYTYRSAAKLARDLASSPEPASRAAAKGDAAASASVEVTVTATVLPVRTIVVQEGVVSEVWSNVAGTSAGASLYIVRSGTSSGRVIRLTPRIWKQARALLLDARPGPGRLA